MIVAEILAHKGRDVANTGPDRPLSEIVHELATRKIGALVVTERGRVVGIVSERDIVKAIGLRSPEILADPVSSIMTRDVVTCREGETINSVMSRMPRASLGRSSPSSILGRSIGPSSRSLNGPYWACVPLASIRKVPSRRLMPLPDSRSFGE